MIPGGTTKNKQLQNVAACFLYDTGGNKGINI